MEYESTKKIIDLLEKSTTPMSMREISDTLNLSMKTTHRILSELQETNKIDEILSDEVLANTAQVKRKVRFFTLVQNNTNPEDKSTNLQYIKRIEPVERKIEYIETELQNKLSEFEHQSKILQERSDSLSEKLNHIYVNIISMMGVFIAIFAIIIINVNEISDIMKNTNFNVLENIKYLCMLSAPLVISIIALLGGVRLILISGLKSSKKDGK